MSIPDRRHPLELRVPPPLLGLIIAAAMWQLTRMPDPPAPWQWDAWRIGGLLCGMAGVAAALAGVRAFRLARTTVNPLRPDTSTALVARGIYRYTRNPMYLGFALVLCGWALALRAPWAWFGPPLYVWLLTRWQILPEERALAARFGSAFDDYCRRVRRWL